MVLQSKKYFFDKMNVLNLPIKIRFLLTLYEKNIHSYGWASGDKLASTVISKLKSQTQILNIYVLVEYLKKLGVNSIFNLNEITYLDLYFAKYLKLEVKLIKPLMK